MPKTVTRQLPRLRFELDTSAPDLTSRLPSHPSCARAVFDNGVDRPCPPLRRPRGLWRAATPTAAAGRLPGVRTFAPTREHLPVPHNRCDKPSARRPLWARFKTLEITDISCRCTRSICTACFVVWRPRRAVDTSTNRRHGFLCRRTASMEHAADTAEAAAVDHNFSSSTENVFVPVCLWTPGNRLMIV